MKRITWRNAFRHRIIPASLIALPLLLNCGQSLAWAGEGTLPAGPIGGTDVSQALLPPPGLYGALYGVGGTADGWYLPSGSTIPASGNVAVGGVGAAYVYPQQIFGGSVASTLVAGYSRVCFGFSSKQCSSGLTDVYSDLFFWSRLFPSSDFAKQPDGPAKIPYGLAVGFGLGMSFPTGAYSAQSSVNVGANVFDIAPSIALTYNTKSLLGDSFGQATEFSGRLFLNNYTKNYAQDYQSGKLLNLDFAVTQRFNQWQYGLAGTVEYQFTDDFVGGLNIGNRITSLTAGPIVSYNFAAGGHPWIIATKASFSVAGENTIRQSAILIRLQTGL